MPGTTSRRSFLGHLAAGAALPLLGTRPFTGVAPPDEPDASYWELVRRQFAFREEKIPMNAANLCPSPRVVAERVAELTRDIDVDCSFNNRAKFRDLLEESRQKVAAYLGVRPTEIALVRNTSEANNTVNNGLKLKAGDEVLLWDQNHPTNNVAWDVRAARFGITVRRVSTPARPSSPEELLETFTNAFGRRTRVLAITHVSNVSGVRLPVRELSEAAHRLGIYVHVDGAQTWGALRVDLKELGCDSYTASTHKWLCGPKEVGVLYVREERIGEIWPNVIAPGWGHDVEPDLPGAKKFESLGQRDDAALAAVGTAIDFHRAVGPERIERHLYELAAALKAGLKDMGLRLVTPEEPTMSAGVCIVEVPREKRREIVNALYQEHGIAAAPTGGLRLCPHLYNTMEHVERALVAVRALRSRMA